MSQRATSAPVLRRRRPWLRAAIVCRVGLPVGRRDERGVGQSGDRWVSGVTADVELLRSARVEGASCAVSCQASERRMPGNESDRATGRRLVVVAAELAGANTSGLENDSRRVAEPMMDCSCRSVDNGVADEALVGPDSRRSAIEVGTHRIADLAGRGRACHRGKQGECAYPGEAECRHVNDEMGRFGFLGRRSAQADHAGPRPAKSSPFENAVPSPGSKASGSPPHDEQRTAITVVDR